MTVSISLTSVGHPDFPEQPVGSIFNDARLKVYRARRHAFEISSVFRQILEANLDTVGLKLNSEIGQYELWTAFSVPVGAGLPVGDAFRCLRSALDYTVSALGRKADLGDKRTLFPFHETRANVVDMFEPPRPPAKPGGKNRPAGSLYQLSLAYPDLKKIIIDEIQPYSADDGANALGDFLWRIASVDNLDKHRVIMPVGNATKIENVTVDGAFISGGGRFTGEGTFPAVTFTASNPNSKLYEDVSIDIVFGQETGFSSKPILDTLIQSANVVDDVINIMEKLVPR